MLSAVIGTARSAAIVGGQPGFPGSFEFTASWNGACSGVLLAARQVLTARHCVDVPPALPPAYATGTSVSIGNPNGGRPTQKRTVLAAVPAPPGDGDLAILELERGSTIRPAVLPANSAEALALQAPNEPAGVVGFGGAQASARLSPLLVEAGLQMRDCAMVAPDLSASAAAQFGCAVPAVSAPGVGFPGGVGPAGGSPCAGDSGGPVVRSTPTLVVLVGVVSGSDAPVPCAAGSPTLFAPLAGALGWLRAELHRRLPRASPPPLACRRKLAALGAARRRLGALERSVHHRPRGSLRGLLARQRARAGSLASEVFARC